MGLSINEQREDRLEVGTAYRPGPTLRVGGWREGEGGRPVEPIKEHEREKKNMGDQRSETKRGFFFGGNSNLGISPPPLSQRGRQKNPFFLLINLKSYT